VFLEVIVLSLGKRTPRISSRHKGIPPSSKRKSVVKKSKVVKYTRQIAPPNLLIVMITKPPVPLLLQV